MKPTFINRRGAEAQRGIENSFPSSASPRLCGKKTPRNWLPDMDLNHDKQIQSLLCYRYTIGQKRDLKM